MTVATKPLTRGLPKGHTRPYLYVLPTETVAALALPVPPDEDDDDRGKQSRKGERERRHAAAAELRAVLATPHFWEIAAQLPNNTIHGPDARRGPGRRKTFPDYLPFLVETLSAQTGTHSRAQAVADMTDDWPATARLIDEYVPAGWTRMRDLRESTKPPLGQRSQALAARIEGKKGIAYPELTIHHVEYFARQMRGKPLKDKDGRRIGYQHAVTSAYEGVHDRMRVVFEESAMRLAQSMGMLDPDMPFHYADPQRAQYFHADGTVMSISRKADIGSSETHTTGERKRVFGSKWTFLSCRIDGQPESRIILGFEHNAKGNPESRTTVDMSIRLAALAGGGAKGVIADSATRGRDITALQRAGLTVVNYPHAASNPDAKGKKGKRLNKNRVEKNHLAFTFTHKDDSGLDCEHHIYWIGGELFEGRLGVDGTHTAIRLPRPTYDARWPANNPNREVRADGKRREYLTVTLTCPHSKKPIKKAIGLFHSDPVTGDPARYDATFNWGEYARVFAPGSDAFKFLYGARNDTESLNKSVKDRVKYLPGDVQGQFLRLLGAAVLMNCLHWQKHLQASGLPNVIKKTG